jgi:uncharacterized membrane protein YeaQ/YmgE (transglycosylase-associated protein family)
MEFNISLGVGGWTVAILGALAFGVIAQLIGEANFGFEWVVDAVAALVGAIVASEFIVGLSTYEPVWDGLALVPAIVGGLVAGITVALLTRYLTGGSFVPASRAA